MKNKKPLTESPTPPLPDIKLPAGPFVERHDGATPKITPNGLAAIKILAGELFCQEEVASALGLSVKVFRSILGKADSEPMSPARAAWESGVAANKGELCRLALAKARAGAMVETLFLLKSVHAFRDMGPAVQVDASQKIAFYQLPMPASEKSYLASLGLDAPIDVRPPHMRVSPMVAMGLLPAPTESESTPTPTEGGSNESENQIHR